MRILAIGGTRFLGRHPVEAALERGHDVTLFNRGKTNASRPEGFTDRAGISREREVALLDEWHGASGK